MSHWRVEQYLVRLGRQVYLPAKRRGRFLAETRAHLDAGVQAYREQGFAEATAVRLALRDIGSAEEVASSTRNGPVVSLASTSLLTDSVLSLGALMVVAGTSDWGTRLAWSATLVVTGGFTIRYHWLRRHGRVRTVPARELKRMDPAAVGWMVPTGLLLASRSAWWAALMIPSVGMIVTSWWRARQTP